MVPDTLEQALLSHPFFDGMEKEHIASLLECAHVVTFQPGDYLCREGEEARSCYLVNSGHVALKIHMPENPVTLETLSQGDVLGWSWMFPPYRWHFDAKAVEMVDAVSLDGHCLRDKCDSEPELGVQLLKRFAELIFQRLQATRLQLLDIYSDKPARR